MFNKPASEHYVIPYHRNQWCLFSFAISR